MVVIMEDFGDSPDYNNKKMKGVIFEFGLNYLLEQPVDFLDYGLDYFEKKLIKPPTIMIQDFSDREIPNEDPYKGYSDKTIINMVMNSTAMLQCLSPEDMEMVKKMAKRREVEAGEVLMTQGERFDYFYIIESGTYDVYIQMTEDEEPDLIHTYQNTGCFGELAILYRRPRAATIISQRSGHVWYVDSTVFLCHIRKHLKHHRNVLGKFFETQKYFSDLNPYEMMQLSDSTSLSEYPSGEVLYRQGFLPVHLWYIISGSVVLVICDEILEMCKIVKKYKAGNHFGEAELFSGNVRSVTAITCENSLLAAIDMDVLQSMSKSAKRHFEKRIPNYEEMVATAAKQVAHQLKLFKKSPYYRVERESM